MVLYNIQDYIENPFNQKGLDDLKIDKIKVNKTESLFLTIFIHFLSILAHF